MRAAIMGLLFGVMALLPLAAAADYTDPFGNTYTSAQVAQFCAHVRLQPAVCGQ